MDLRNLNKNILYRICEVLTQENRCGSVKIRSIYRSFADIPEEKVAEGIQSLVHSGWLRQETARGDRLRLTNRGWLEIRSRIPASLLSTCEKPADCPASPGRIDG